MEQVKVNKFALTFLWSVSKNFASDLHSLNIINPVGAPFNMTKPSRTMKSDCR